MRCEPAIALVSVRKHLQSTPPGKQTLLLHPSPAMVTRPLLHPQDMNTLIKALLFGLHALAVSQACADSEFSFLVNGKRYEYRITSSQLADSPKWDPQKEDNPPFPAAKA